MPLPWRQRSAPGEQTFRRVPIRDIRPNPRQPRTRFDMQALQSLSDSIRQYGVITPLTLRETPEGYELIAGERRLRAARMAGLTVVPCYILPASGQESALMALLENLQREDLDCFEEAAFLHRLCQEFHMTQQEAAARVGKTQPAVANKLRLLRLSPQVVAAVRQYGLTERHARCLLTLEEDRRPAAAEEMGKAGMTVAQAESYVEALLARQEEPAAPALPHGPRRTGLIRDVRLFCNTMEKAVRLMQSSGLPASMERRQEGEDLVFTVRVRANGRQAPAPAPADAPADNPADSPTEQTDGSPVNSPGAPSPPETDGCFPKV